MAPSDPSTLSTTPICPKCGYDQSGEVATWESVCPVRGRCPECGLAFAWCDIFDPVLNDLYWYAEHGRSVWAMVWRTPGTLARLILPHRFWREVDVTKRVSIWRMMIWVVLVMVLTHLLVSIPTGIGLWNSNNWSGYTVRGYIDQYGLYGIAKVIFDGIASPYFSVYPQRGQFILSMPVTVNWGRYWYEGLFRPIGFQLGFVLLWLVVLMAVPQTKRMANLRSVHIARAVMFSVLVMVLSIELFRLSRAMYGLTGYSFDFFTEVTYWIVPIAMLWQIAFWSCAIAIGWRVYPWKLLVGLGTTAALLGGLVLRIYVFVAMTT